MLPPAPFPVNVAAPLPVRRRARAAALALATTALTTALTAAALTGCGTDSDDPVPASDRSSASEPSSDAPVTPSDEASPEPTSEASQEPSGTAIPVYFVGDGPGGAPRLFREFQRVEGDPLTVAARLIAGGGQSVDPDYRTLWPQVEISSVSPTDGVILVEIPSDAFTERPDAMTRRDARLAVQQLVYTLQGVQQERVPVQVLRPDTDARLFGLSTEAPFAAKSPLRTLNLVNITSPAEGDTVSADTLMVTGVANSFEASGPCRLIVGGKEVALEGYQSDGWMEDRLFPFEVELPLDGVSGEVVVQCETDDPSGGTEGNGPAIDTKTITVD